MDESELQISIGKSARENDQLVRNSDQNYWWFHLKNHPSPHVIAHSDELNRTEIKRCAAAVVENSKLKNLRRVSVIYTQVKTTDKSGTVELSKAPLNITM